MPREHCRWLIPVSLPCTNGHCRAAQHEAVHLPPPWPAQRQALVLQLCPGALGRNLLSHSPEDTAVQGVAHKALCNHTQLQQGCYECPEKTICALTLPHRPEAEMRSPQKLCQPWSPAPSPGR